LLHLYQDRVALAVSIINVVIVDVVPQILLMFAVQTTNVTNHVNLIQKNLAIMVLFAVHTRFVATTSAAHKTISAVLTRLVLNKVSNYFHNVLFVFILNLNTHIL
jgi:hypothetical protein